MSSRGGPLEDIDAAETVPEHSSVLRPKVVVLGSIGSGKTALFRSFASHLKRNDPSTISPSRGGDEVGETALPPFSARHGLRATLPKQRAMSTDSVASYEDWGSIDASLRPSTTIEVHDVPYVASFPVTTSPARNDSGPFATPALDGARLDVWDVPGTAAENPSMCTSVLRGAGALIVAVDAISMRTMEARFGLGMTDSVSMLAMPWLDAALVEPPSASPFAKGVGRAGGSVPSSRPPSPAPYGGNPFRAKRGHLDEEMLTVANVGSAKDYSDTVPQLRAVVVLITKIDAVAFGGDEDERILCRVQRMMQERYQHVAPFADFAVLACSAVSGAGVCELVSKVGAAALTSVEAARTRIATPPHCASNSRSVSRSGGDASHRHTPRLGGGVGSSAPQQASAQPFSTGCSVGRSLDVTALDDSLRADEIRASELRDVATRSVLLAPTPRRHSTMETHASSSASPRRTPDPSPRASSPLHPSPPAAALSVVVERRIGPKHQRSNSSSSCLVA